MRSLFSKIFLYFLLIIILVSSASVLLTFLRNQQFIPLAHKDFARTAIAKYGGDAIDAYERGGSAALDSYVRELRERSGISVTLFDEQARPLHGRMGMRMHHLQRLAQQALQSGEVVLPGNDRRNAVAATVRSDSGQQYVLTLFLPDRPPSRQLFDGIQHGAFGLELLLLLAISALVSYLLARSLSAPIGRLRQATRRFAGGDLSTRIGSGVKGSRELVGLADDFDLMAADIEELISAQKRLLRDISHELRSPLTRLGIALELARKQAGDEQQRSLERIELESQRMNEMIGQLLTLTRFETDGRTTPFAPFDLTSLLNELVQDANFEAAGRGGQVQLSAPEAIGYNGSQELLRQALENVIRNAVKYSADNSSVLVSVQKNAAELRIEVADRGPGVPEAALEKLFAPFYRVEDDRNRQRGGNGIGLAIAERSVRLHSGTIKAENRAEGGLLVTIELPLSAPGR